MTDHVEIKHHGPFGYLYSFKIPEGCELVLVCVETPGGRLPVSIRLPHQVYIGYAAQILLDYPEATSVSVYSLRGAERIDLPCPAETGRAIIDGMKVDEA